MRNVYIIGAHTLKFGNYLDYTYDQLVGMTVPYAMEDAGVSKQDIEAIHFGNVQMGFFTMQHGLRGQVTMRKNGFYDIPITNHEGGCATGSMTVYSGWKDILTGLFDCVLAVGVEKILDADKMKTFKSFELGTDTSDLVKAFEMWNEANKDCRVSIPEGQDTGMRSMFMDIYRNCALWFMDHYGLTQKQLAIAASKNHFHSTMNPNAQYQFPVSVEQVLNDYVVTYPLTRSMCAPMGDGAASVVICSEEFLRKQPDEVQRRAVKILASAFGSYRNVTPADLSYTVRPAGSSIWCSQKAYDLAGLGPEDIDVAEVHDASSLGEIVQCENLGFCAYGEGGKFVESGATTLGGKLPINTSGGLISRGHPIAASGLAMMHELVTQLRGEAGQRQVAGAKIGLCENGGGFLGLDEAACVVTILAAQ